MNVVEIYSGNKRVGIDGKISKIFKVDSKRKIEIQIVTIATTWNMILAKLTSLTNLCSDNEWNNMSLLIKN
jgi:hypothetical protein